MTRAIRQKLCRNRLSEGRFRFLNREVTHYSRSLESRGSTTLEAMVEDFRFEFEQSKYSPGADSSSLGGVSVAGAWIQYAGGRGFFCVWRKHAESGMDKGG